MSLQPKFFTTIRAYNRELFLKDLVAGVIVGIVAIPLAIAFAIASGVSPEKGLYTAIIAGFLISFLGGSRVQIGGPTGAFVVIVYGIIEKYGINGLILATLLAGVILIAMGVAKFGGLIKFIPFPILTGFTTGIAVIIFSSQIKDFFGMDTGKLPSEFLAKWNVYFHKLNTVNWNALGIAALALLIIVIWPKVNRRIPGSLVAILVTTALVKLAGLDDVATINTQFPQFKDLPNALPAPVLPHFASLGDAFEAMRGVMMPAVTIAMLAAIESLMSAAVADGMIGSRHRPNAELIAQGAANLASPLFGGIPATGAIARTATNVKNGGRTPVAGMIHAVTLLLILCFFLKWAGMIPMATLAAILVFVAYNMAELHAFAGILRGPKSDITVLLITFLLTVLIELTVAIEVGMVMTAFLFMKKMADLANVSIVKNAMKDDEAEGKDSDAIGNRVIPKGVEVYEINGPFFFGSLSKFQDAVALDGKRVKVLIVRMRHVPYMDASGIHTLEELHKRCKHHGVALLISDIHTQPFMIAHKSGLVETIGQKNFAGSIDDCLAAARALLAAGAANKAAETAPAA